MYFSDCPVLYIELLFEAGVQGIVVSEVAVSLAEVEMAVSGGEGGADQLMSVSVRSPAAREVGTQLSD